jgi:hypothetical protein
MIETESCFGDFPFGNSVLVSNWKARRLLHPRYGVLRNSDFPSDITASKGYGGVTLQ